MSARLSTGCARWLLVAMLCALSGCSSFEGKWRAAEKGAGPHSPTRWDGRWTSEKHRTRAGESAGGRLRCVLAEVQVATNCFPPSGSRIKPSTQSQLRADFRANWLIFASSYTMPLSPVPGSRTDFRGVHQLPAIFGGTYRYTARITGDRFTARYDSSYDRGTFEMTRVRP